MTISALLLLAPLALTSVQEEGESSPQAPSGAEVGAQDGITPAPLGLIPLGIEAPEQPRGQSSSRFTRGPRNTPRGREGNLGRISTPVGSLVAVRGMERNVVWGIGLVDGLQGTGDSKELARQLLQNLLKNQNLSVPLGSLTSENMAVVRVEAEIPAGIEPGRSIDVRVSSIGDAESLVGGTLMMTELTDLSGREVYATASGPLTVGGFRAEGDAASTTKNHTTVGVLPGGGKIVSEVATEIVSEHGYLYLDARAGQDTFGNVVAIVDSINDLYPGLAQVTPDGKTVRVKVPDDLLGGHAIAFLDTILKREVISDNSARVVINERTGVIVMGGDVRLRPGAIQHGAIIVTIAESAETSQPGLSPNGTTENQDRTELGVTEDNSGLVLVPGAVTLEEVVDVLNVLGATPRDMISILGAMSDGGLLVADIRRL